MRPTLLPFARFVPLLLLAAAVTGCAGESTTGALDQSSFGQGCAGSTLPCSREGDLHAPLAAGASVDLTVDLMLQGGGQPPLQLASTDPTVFTVKQQTLTGVATGLATLLLTTADGIIVDFVAIWVQQPVALSLSRLSPEGTALGQIPGKLGLVAGDRASVAVSTLSSSQPLTGSPETTWTVDDPSVASVVDEGVLGVGSIVAHAPGKATVTASALGLETSFVVEVSQ